MNETDTNLTGEDYQLLAELGGSRTPRPVRVKSIRDARRLLSRLILQMQKDEIESRKAKDITYVLSVYIDATKSEELEHRIQALEQVATQRRNGSK